MASKQIAAVLDYNGRVMPRRCSNGVGRFDVKYLTWYLGYNAKSDGFWISWCPICRRRCRRAFVSTVPLDLMILVAVWLFRRIALSAVGTLETPPNPFVWANVRRLRIIATLIILYPAM